MGKIKVIQTSKMPEMVHKEEQMKFFFEQYGETIFFFLLALTVVVIYRRLADLSILS